MSAINLARLKIQAVRLSEKFSDPESFIHDLNEILDFYTNRTIRATQITQRLSLPTFHTPLPVLRQIQSELIPLVDTHPGEAIALTNALWKTSSLEGRLLAAYLLGSIPLAQALPSLTHLPDWLAQSTDNEISNALLTDAFIRVRRENPESLFLLLEEWLKSGRSSLQVWGLRALIPLLIDPQFENLPAVFRILKPTVRSAGPITQLELQACFATLEKISLVETLAFLREMIDDNPAPLMLRTFRRMLGGLSPELQEGLRKMLRDHSSQA